MLGLNPSAESVIYFLTPQPPAPSHEVCTSCVCIQAVENWRWSATQTGTVETLQVVRHRLFHSYITVTLSEHQRSEASGLQQMCTKKVKHPKEVILT